MKTPTSPPSLPSGDILLYRAEDGSTRIEVRMEGETVWLTQKAMAELYQTTSQNITQHIGAIYEEKELTEAATCKEFLQVQSEGNRSVRRILKYYNLDIILAVGYRIRSLRGTQFRIWATERLREYLLKGFTMDDDRLKRAGGERYFEELLERIRDIRSSERVFWRKVLDIYATSIDYDPSADASQLFFQTVQNKIHWAVHGHTAAEIIYDRANAEKSNMGLTSWDGVRPRKADAAIAKNYLNTREIGALNRIVMAYMEFAELQALSRRPMYMKDWITKINDFLQLSDHKLLTHPGKISHEKAMQKATVEFEKYRHMKMAIPQPVDQHFEDVVRDVKILEKGIAQKKKRGKRRTS